MDHIEVPFFDDDVDDDDTVTISRSEYNGLLRLLDMHKLGKTLDDMRRGYSVIESRHIGREYQIDIITPFDSSEAIEAILSIVEADLSELYGLTPPFYMKQGRKKWVFTAKLANSNDYSHFYASLHTT